LKGAEETIEVVSEEIEKEQVSRECLFSYSQTTIKLGFSNPGFSNPGYNDNGYNEFTSIRSKVCRLM